MRITIILLLIIINGYSYAQDFYLECGKEKIPCQNGGINHFAPITYCPYVEYTSDSLIPQFIIDINQNYLKERLQDSFSKIEHRENVIIEHENFDEIKKTKGWITTELCNPKVKYAFEYFWTIPDGMNFYFTTVYDSNGIMLSKHQIPDFKKNINADKILNYCQVKDIVEKDKKFKGKIAGIRLDYSDKDNSFIWIIEKPEIYKGKDKRTVINRFIVINAMTGIIMNYFTEKGYIVCRMPKFDK